MAKRAQITLSDKDVELLELLSKDHELSTSGAISRALRIASELEKVTKDGKKIVIRDKNDDKETMLAIV